MKKNRLKNQHRQFKTLKILLVIFQIQIKCLLPFSIKEYTQIKEDIVCQFLDSVKMSNQFSIKKYTQMKKNQLKNQHLVNQ